MADTHDGDAPGLEKWHQLVEVTHRNCLSGAITLCDGGKTVQRHKPTVRIEDERIDLKFL